MQFSSNDKTIANMKEACCEGLYGDDWILLEETEPNSRLSFAVHINDEIPDLISNISPTSLSTTTSDEEKDRKANTNPTYDKSESNENRFFTEAEIISELMTPATHSSCTARCGILFRFVVPAFLLISAFWIHGNTRTFQLSKNISLPLYEYYQDQFKTMEEEQMLFQEDSQSPNLDTTSEIPVEAEMQHRTTFSAATEIQQQKEDQSIHPDWKQLEINGTEQVLLQQHSTIQNETAIYLPSTFDIRSNDMYHFLQQMASEFGTATCELAKYVNGVFDDFASSKNAKIWASKLSMVGDQDPLIHVWEAAKSMVTEIIRRVGDIVDHMNNVLDDLATKNAEIHSSQLSIEEGGKSMMYEVKKKLSSANTGMQTSEIIHMDGVRESFTKMKRSIRKETSKMMAHKIKMPSMTLYI